jgi:hypothetical protein
MQVDYKIEVPLKRYDIPRQYGAQRSGVRPAGEYMAFDAAVGCRRRL